MAVNLPEPLVGQLDELAGAARVPRAIVVRVALERLVAAAGTAKGRTQVTAELDAAARTRSARRRSTP